MTFIHAVRLIFVIAAGVAGITIYNSLLEDPKQAELFALVMSCLIGMMVAGIVIFAEARVQLGQPKTLMMGMLGLFLGMALAFMLYNMFESLGALEGRPVGTVVQIVLYTLFGYLGVVICLRYQDRIDFTQSKLFATLGGEFRGGKILDSSVVIDGRFADVVETEFVEGPILVPRFVLQEVQAIADSPNALKRKRGRRGLDIIRRMQHSTTGVIVVDDDFPAIRSVDAKLVELGKKYGASVVTNDYNLNKVAEIQNVQVLNINDLAGALRPVVLPDEEMQVHVVKEGKEESQGIGYLEDGTMVVVENGARRINQAVTVIVTRVLQTTAGRMVFTRIVED